MLRSCQRVAQKHRDRHRADAARNRGHEARDVEDRRIDVADELPVLRAVHADVDDGRARLHHVGRHEPGPADGGDEDVGAARVLGEIRRARVADRHGRVLREEQHRHRLADDLAAADDDRLLALQLDPVLGEHHHHARGRRRHEERLAEEEEPGVLTDGSRRRPWPDRPRAAPSARPCARAAGAGRGSRRRRRRRSARR